ncbi:MULTISPECIES: YybH family protein [unclassified Moraxella]|uniref:YybH family protein n=1 Tax=unclassified Moraxella TaxID=2685852 RepID=UPI003AF98154
MGQTTPSSSANLAEKSPKQAILDTLQFYQTAMAKGDTDAIMSVFADDAVIEFQGKPTLQGKSAIRQSYEQAFDVMDFTGIDYISTSVEVIGDTAIVRTTHADNATVYHKKLAKKIVDNNREVFVFKNKNGAWQISYYMYNQKAGH